MTVDNVQRPWAAFIGLVSLKASEFVSKDTVYAMNPQVSGIQMEPTVIIHPTGIPAAKKLIENWAGRVVSDAELAAFLYWTAYKKRTRND